jgi:threonine ammonia-lyase medium form
MTTYHDILAARTRLKAVAHKTPLLTSHFFDETTSNRVVFKCENFQRTGSFKFRGAYNRIAKLSVADQKRGLVAFSSGNHAQGVALAAKLLNLSAKIVMPNDAPESKLAATRSYGAEVILYDRYRDDREAIAKKIQDEENRVLIPPFDHPDIIAGQGTIGLEIAEELDDLDILLCPVGGGGLISGTAIALKEKFSHLEVVGIEPEHGNDVQLSLKENRRVTIKPFHSLADGIQTLSPGEHTFPLLKKLVNEIQLVSEDEIRAALKLAVERLKIILEPTSATAVAALLRNERAWKNKHVCVMVCGGNIDLKILSQILSS